MAAATLTSRVLGMVREMVYAAFMGNGWVASAFFMAFQVPNLFRRLLGEGALTAAFIPIFKHKEVQEGEKEMWRAANAVISGLVAAAGALTIVAIIGLSIALAAGNFELKTALMLKLLRFMFPYMLLVCLAAVFIARSCAKCCRAPSVSPPSKSTCWSPSAFPTGSMTPLSPLSITRCD